MATYLQRRRVENIANGEADAYVLNCMATGIGWLVEWLELLGFNDTFDTMRLL